MRHRWLGLLFCLGLFSCAPREPRPRDRLVMYAAGPRNLAEQIAADFTAETGIPVDLFQATTGQIMARLEAERYRPRADVVLFASEVAAAALKSENRLLQHVPASAEHLREGWSDPDGFYHATSAALVGIATTLSAPPLPARWPDILAMPDGLRLVMPSPSRSGAAGDFLVAYLINFPEGLSQFEQARAGGLEFAAANSQAISSLLMGAQHGVIGAVDYLIYRQIERGDPLRMFFPEEGAVLVTRPIAILRQTPNPDAARALVDFYFREETQRRIAAAHLLPGRADIPPSPVRDPEPPQLIRADPQTALRKQSALLRDFQLRVERAMVIPEARP